MEIKASWWSEDHNTHKAIHDYISVLSGSQLFRNTTHLEAAKMYGGEKAGHHLFSYAVDGETLSNITQKRGRQAPVRLNVVKSCVDTVTARIAKNRPKPMFLTEGGDYTLQKKAKLLSKFMEGMFKMAGMYKEMPTVFRDAALFGNGHLKVFRDGTEIKVERVFPAEIIIDEAESIHGSPRQMHQKKLIPREVLLAEYPEHRADIETCKSEKIGKQSEYMLSNMIPVVESWHLPSGPEEKDGRHCISIETALLFDEEYTEDYFPFVSLEWDEPLAGYWSKGLAEELKGIQLELNHLMDRIQRAIHRIAVPRVYLQNGSKIVKSHINNEVGAIVSFTGTPPIFDSPQALHPEVYQQLERLYAKAYEVSGITQLSATGHKPAGINSGAALREYNDIETERFVTVGQRYEQAFLDAAAIFMDLARDIQEEEGSFPVMIEKDHNIEMLDWKDVHVQDHQYSIQIWPVSLFPSTPAGKLETVAELVNIGIIDRKEDIIRLLDLPDLESVTGPMVASNKQMDSIIEKMVDDGIYTPPEPIMDLQHGLMRMSQAYLQYRLKKVSETRLALMRTWLTEAQQMLSESQPQPAEQMPAQPVEGELEAPQLQ